MDHRACRAFIVLGAVIFLQASFLLDNRSEPVKTAPPIFKIEAKQDEAWFERAIGDPVALFTLILTAFTGGLFISTYNLWVATKQLVAGAERTTAIQSRAYVSIVRGAVLLVQSMDGYTVHISFKNSGPTPAYEVLTRIEGDIYRYDDTPFRDVPPHDRNQRSIIGPGDEIHINTPSTSVSSNDLFLVRAGKRAILIWGSAEYTDIFGKRFCFRYRCRMSGAEAEITKGRLGWVLQPHPLGYDEDVDHRASLIHVST